MNVCESVTMPVYSAVGREVQLSPDWSWGGNGSKHQMRKLQQRHKFCGTSYSQFYNKIKKLCQNWRFQNISEVTLKTTDLPLEPGRQSAGVRASEAHPGVVAGQVEALADVSMKHSQVHKSEHTHTHTGNPFTSSCVWPSLERAQHSRLLAAQAGQVLQLQAVTVGAVAVETVLQRHHQGTLLLCHFNMVSCGRESGW